MIDLVKMVSLIAKNEGDKPASIDFNGRVGGFVFRNHNFKVEWTEGNEQVSFESSNNKSPSSTISILENLQHICFDYFKDHLIEYDIALNRKYGFLLITHIQ